MFQDFFLDLEKVQLGLQVTQLCGKSVLGACVIRENTFFPRKYFSAKRENTFWLKIETGGKAGLIRPSGETNSLNNEEVGKKYSNRVAEVAREHGWHPPKSLDLDENFKPNIRYFVAN